MRLAATLKISLRALRRNTLRSVLTGLGMIIGVGAVIAMVSLGSGAKAQVEAQIASLGQNLIQVLSGSMTRGGMNTGWGGAGTLSIEDAVAIKRELSNAIGVSPEVRTFAQVMAGNQNWYTQILGASEDYLDIRQWELAGGANFTEQDVRSATKVAIIGRTTARQLFGDQDPVGQIVRIKNVPFVIAGELTPKGMSAFGSDQDDVVIVPYTSAMKRLAGQINLRSINVQAASAAQLNDLQEEINQLMRQRHRILPGRDDDFTVRTQQEITDRFTEASKTMRLLLGGIASVSLLVGGIGIMNIMLVSVTERTREIGIRMAVGAHGADVLMQFLIEALMLSSIGGLIGIGAGIGASRVLTTAMQWPALISLDSIVVAFVFSAAVGIFFGFYPARKASQLDPIEALRYE
ncbi:MAG TPA: ABC transporter permease [Verrucomicrobiae bacterium]|jgi:putative ABC transport system permease protein